MTPENQLPPEDSRANPVNAQLKLMRGLYAVAATPPDQLNTALTQVVEAVADAFSVEYVSIHLYDMPNQISTVAAEYPQRGFGGESLPFRETPFPDYFAANVDALPLVIDDLSVLDERIKQPLPSFERAGVKSALITPLRVNDTLIGTLNLMMISAPRPFPRQILPLAQTIANLLAVSIQNVRLAASLHHQVDQAEQISALGRRIMSTQDQNTIMREAADLTSTYMPAEGISVALHWLGEPTLRLYLIDRGRILPAITVPYDQSWLRYAYESNMPLVLDNLAGGSQMDYEALVHHAMPNGWSEGDLMHSAMIIPLIAGGQTIGTYNLLRRQPKGFTPANLGIANQVAVQLAVALENVRLFAQTAEQLRSERLRAQLGGRVGRITAERVDDILLATLQQVGGALGAQRARVRLTPNVAIPETETPNADPKL